MRIENPDDAHMVATFVDVIYGLIVAHKKYHNGISEGEIYAFLMGTVNLAVFKILMGLVAKIPGVEQNGLCWRIKK